MYSEDVLLSWARSSSSYSVINAIKDSNTTVRVIMEAVRISKNADVLIAALDSPLLNEEIFRAIFEKTKLNTYYGHNLLNKIINHPMFSKDMFDYYVENSISSYNIDDLLNCVFANEESVIKIINKINDSNRTAILNAVCNSTILTPKIVEVLLKRSLSSDNIIKLIDSSVVNEDLLKELFIKYLLVSSKSNSIEYVVNHPKMTKKILYEIASNSEVMSSSYLKTMIDSPYCDEDLLKIIRVGNEETFNAILNNPNTTPDVLIKLINSHDTYKYNKENILNLINHRSTDERVLTEVFRVTSTLEELKERKYDYQYDRYRLFDIDRSLIAATILKHPLVTEQLEIEIAKKYGYNSVIFNMLSKKSKDVRIALYLNQNYLNDSVRIDEFFAIPGLTIGDVINGMEFGNLSYYKKVIESGFDNEELNSLLVSKLCEKPSNISERNKLLGLMLNRDLQEDDLIKIIQSRNTLANILGAISHDNASMKVVDEALKRSSSIDSSTDRDRVVSAANELRKRIINNIYKIEKEEDVSEILRMNVEDRLSTMLWGPSGVGKTSRVFEIDPTATMLILKNGMLPEEVIGGKEPNGNPGEIYPPHWYKVLCEKCEKEPDRMHILFIDEFTNVSDTIKNLVWEVIGSRLVNGHEEWPLPENCSIVVAGNRPEESSAVKIDASGGVMPAPLHNRIDSMIEIQFDVDEWQKWALETDPKTGNLRIHPIVYSFCISHADKVMFSNFNPEKVTEPFLSPRKWETLSRAIYSAEKRGPFNHISDARIASIIGNNEISAAFISHYERLPIDMNKIIMGKYKESDFPSIDDKLYALGMIIANYNGDEIAIESFILDCLGDEYLSIYHNMKDSRNSVLASMNREGAKKL